jgi:hypothetical protein
MTMKRKGLIIATAIFFLTVSTNYFWEGKLGLFTFPAFILLVVVYLVLAIGLLSQLFYAVKEKFVDRQRLFVIVLMALVLSLTSIFPGGIINFDTLEGKDLFIAQRGGAANCMTTFKLKEDNEFVERSVCFGVTETKGNYIIKGDTIFFSNVSLGRGDSDYYEFAVINKSDSQSSKILGNMLRFKNHSDTTGDELWIIKNDLTK